MAKYILCLWKSKDVERARSDSFQILAQSEGWHGINIVYIHNHISWYVVLVVQSYYSFHYCYGGMWLLKHN